MANVTLAELKSSIAQVLKGADLAKLSSKIIRKLCEEKFQTDLTSRKQEIDEIVMAYIAGEKNNEDESDKPSENESVDDQVSESESEISDERPSPPVKKTKLTSVKNSKPKTKEKKSSQKKKVSQSDASSNSDNDAAVARKLQEEEWNFRRRRAVKKIANKRQSTGSKKKEGDEKPKARKGTSVYTKKCLLSPELAAVMESDEMARPDVVKKMWSIVRERNLFDPSNKQFALCDEQLQKVFGAKRVRMFGMMKYLKNHIKDLK